jgi:hypothetical protein
MFRATVCPSSGENTVPTRHLVLVTLYRWLSGMQGRVSFRPGTQGGIAGPRATIPNHGDTLPTILITRINPGHKKCSNQKSPYYARRSTILAQHAKDGDISPLGTRHSLRYVTSLKLWWNKSNKMQQLRFLFAMALLYMFRVTISPIIRSTMLYMATGELAHCKLTNSLCYNNIYEHKNQLYYIS